MKYNFKRLALLSAAMVLCGIAGVSAILGSESRMEEKSSGELASLNGEPVTATFKFDLGTEKQVATFSNADYFLSSKVTYGSNLSIDGTDNKKNGQTWFIPATQDGAPSEDNAIRFLIQPKFGLEFTPVKVSFKATRYGTDGGKLDMAWQNPDGTVVALDSEKTPARDNGTPNVTEYSYEITGATVAEGACGLRVNLYSLGNTKHIGFSDIVIEGKLSGDEREVPMLASFSANNVDYVVEDLFVADGGNYIATIELASYETMISAANPVSDVVASAGTVGTVTYDGDNDKCAVTIPVSLKDITINYIANFVRKPFYTLTYFNTDGTEMGTQSVEKEEKIAKFDLDYTAAKADEGMKVRGWFTKPVYSKKYSVNDVITGNTSLYAVATAIEEQSTHKKYDFNLRSETFYPEDHEAFNTDNGYFHDTTHGWAFTHGDRIDLLVGPKAAIYVTLCRYGNGTNMVVKNAKGETLETLPAKASNDTDGEVVVYNHDGDAGTISLCFEAEGELYIHNVKIVNNAEINYESNGQWYFVKPNDAGSLLDVIDAVNAANAKSDSERSFIFLPDGVYDLRQTVLTNISGHNISVIGQSQKGTVIKNAPHHTTEGINSTATIYNTGSNNYFQDLTIQNALDYYSTTGGKQVGGRAVALWDKGTNTICKNVTLLSYQDTYYTNNPNGKYYWADSDIHGTVDFICGDGTLFVENSTLTVEKRNADGKGECTLTAPSTKAGDKYGYVFLNCTIDNYAEKYNLGRAWSNEPRCAYINTTVSDNKMNANRWTPGGMNVAAKCFVEYNTVDKDGKVVSPASHVVTFTKGDQVNKMETILTAEEAGEYALAKVFPAWAPSDLSAQVKAPVAVIENGVITWNGSDDALGYAIYKNDELLAIVTGTSSYTDADAKESDVFTIRAINKMGGHGVAGKVYINGGIDSVSAGAEVVSSAYYNLQGVAVSGDYKGIVIRIDTFDNGKTSVTKLFNR